MSETIRIESAKDLTVYKVGYALAMEIFHATKAFPPEERFALNPDVHVTSRTPPTLYSESC